MSNIYAEILERVERGEALTLKTELCGSDGLIAEGLKKTIAPYAPQTDKRGRYFADVTLTETEGKITVGEPFSPPERLIVLGAGHIAVPVCDFAAKSGFEVYVCDDRLYSDFDCRMLLRRSAGDGHGFCFRPCRII